MVSEIFLWISIRILSCMIFHTLSLSKTSPFSSRTSATGYRETTIFLPIGLASRALSVLLIELADYSFTLRPCAALLRNRYSQMSCWPRSFPEVRQNTSESETYTRFICKSYETLLKEILTNGKVLCGSSCFNRSLDQSL